MAISHPHLKSAQLRRLNEIAARLGQTNRSTFFGRVAAGLKARGAPRPSDHDLDVVIDVALQGLQQEPASTMIV